MGRLFEQFEINTNNKHYEKQYMACREFADPSFPVIYKVDNVGIFAFV